MQASRWLRRLIAALPWLAAHAAALAQSTAALPMAPVRNVQDSYFGTVVDDPYRYFENVKDPEVAAWMKAQADHAQRVLGALPERRAFYDRMVALEAASGERVNRVQRSADGSLFYLHRGVGDNQFKLVVRARPDATMRVLVDPEVLRAKTGHSHAINWFRPSPNGRYVGYGLSAGGSEAASLHVIDVKTGREMISPIARGDYAVPQWIDEHSFTFQQLKLLAPGTPEVEKYRDTLTLRADLRGGRIETLPVRQWKDLALTPDMEVALRRLPGVAQASVLVGDGVRNEIAFFVGPWTQVANPKARWTRVIGFDDGVVGYGVHEHTLYALTHQGAPRFRIVAYDLQQPTQPPREVVAASDRVISDLSVSADALYFSARDGNAKRLWRVAHRGGAKPQEVPLPVTGQIFLGAGYGNDFNASRQSGLIVGLQSWTQPLQYLAVPARGPVRALGLPQLPTIAGLDELQADEVLVKSHDGAMVPMSIIHKKGMKRDGRNPVWLNAYASYGFTIDPAFSPARLAWLERGGVMAVANPRGSSVFGHDWYLAGKQATKPNTWKDVFACAEYLVREGWTTPAHLGFSGRSAGGMLAGMVLTERPDLFAAVVPNVGVHDMVRMELTPNGPSNIPEFGTVANEPGFRALLAMSPYHPVKDGTAYPAVLLTHGINDPCVEVWASTKMAARLLAATSSAKPVLLRLDYDSGHGVGNTRAQQLEEDADTYAFLWSQLAAKDAAARP
ncbi:MAG: S9 family peptidase [Betaproteobacteria bacterium]|nr:MAG: S9 family peptidase [Betaproteobacteria bacterium]